MKDKIIKIIKEIAEEQSGSLGSDGEYMEFYKGEEQYILDNEDINCLADELIKLLNNKQT